MNALKWGALAWTASGAGWAVLAYLTGLPECGITAVLCLGMAAVFNELGSE